MVMSAQNLRKFFISTMLVTLFLCSSVVKPAFAQNADTDVNYAREQLHNLQNMRESSPRGNEPLLELNGRYMGNNPYLKNLIDTEARYGEEVVGESGYSARAAPDFPQIQFYEMDKPATLSQRIEALLQGITVMLPQEYDLYGYEIRRYMAKVAGPDVLGDKKRLAEEIANTKRANIILEYWIKNLNAEIKAISEDLDAQGDEAVPSTRTSFKFNAGKANAFMIEAGSWVDNNQKMLTFLYEIDGEYEYHDPVINFENDADLERFSNLFRAREKAVEIIRGYSPYRMMIY